MHNYFKIRSIRHILDTPTTAHLCLSLCILHLDYCNSVLYGLPECTINKLHRVQNMCVYLALRWSKWDSITECLRELHWLTIKYKIEYKILTLTHKCLNKTGPKYLQDLISFRQQGWQGLRSSRVTNLLLRPATKCKTFTERSFSVVAPVLWNALPDSMWSMDPLTFRKALNTHLFRQAFNG